MSTNEECLIKYLSNGEKSATNSLIEFLALHNINFTFNQLNPVCNIIDELEFFDVIKYN